MVPIEEYLKLRQRPPGRPAMYQNWRDLTFLHFTTGPDAIQKLLPPGLTVDTFPNKDGVERAYIGLVPFRMEGIRPVNLPAAPWISAFPETNVRTYVHREGKDPGVWFFSLDAARSIACTIARTFYKLPYWHATMSCQRQGGHVSYASKRRKGGPAELEIEIETGEALPPSEPGSLEFFLIERYLLYAEANGLLFSGQVHHVPYPLRTACVESCSQSLLEAVGIPCAEWEHVCFSTGVDVEVFALTPASG